MKVMRYLPFWISLMGLIMASAQDLSPSSVDSELRRLCESFSDFYVMICILRSVGRNGFATLAYRVSLDDRGVVSSLQGQGGFHLTFE